VPNLFGNLPADTLLDAGILSIGSTPLAVSRGGLSGTVTPEWRSVAFGGGHTPIAGLDRKVGVTAKFAGVFVEFAPEDVLIYAAQETGSLVDAIQGAPSLSTAVAASVPSEIAATYTCDVPGIVEGAAGLIVRGRYVEDLRLTWLRGGGGDVRMIFPVALCTKYSLRGKDREEAEISVEFEARLDLSNSTDTDQLPYHIEVRDT